MGCCFSRPAGPNSPYPGGINSGSSRAINPSSAPGHHHTAATGSAPGGTLGGEQDAQASPTTSSSRRRHRHPRDQGPLDQHIDKPLRRHEWTSRNRIWTPRTLARERADFFDTRVTGRSEVWQTLHSALQVLWDPPAVQGASGDDGSGGLATAQIILTAAEITLPTGDLAQGAYDSLGNYYALPEWVVADPTNLGEDDELDEAVADSKGDITAGEETAEELDDDEAVRRREEKGKGVLDVRDQITVQARLSENSQDVHVSVAKSESVRSVARKIQEESGLPTTKKIRLAYMGKILKENAPLLDQGWKQGHVVNALVFNR